MALKFTKKEVSLVEAYALTLVVTASGIYSSGVHDLKKVAWSAVLAVFTPVYLAVKAKVKAKVAANGIKVAPIPASSTPAK